jgi:gas vesicle protein
MGETAEAIGYKTDVRARAKDSVNERVESVRTRITGVGRKAGDAAPSGEEVRAGARRAAGIAKENPIGLALGGVAAGFLAGLALPSSRVEDEKLGAMSSQVKETAAETAQEALERGKEVASEAVEGAKEGAQQSAKEQAGELKESVQQRAEQVRER